MRSKQNVLVLVLEIVMTEYRNEWKYICTEIDLELLRRRISPLMSLDRNQKGRSCYNIRSLYFDDATNSCFYANTEGLDHRKKFRIRIYNKSSERIRLEIKYKVHGLTKKESCALTEEQCRVLMTGGTLPFRSTDPKPLRDLCLAMKTQGMHPVEIVEYERTAYVYPVGNVRVTFDRNISGSKYVERFLDQDLLLLPVMPQGQHVLEVKFDEVLPSYIAAALDTGRLERTAFSKYYLCRLRLNTM